MLALTLKSLAQSDFEMQRVNAGRPVPVDGYHLDEEYEVIPSMKHPDKRDEGGRLGWSAECDDYAAAALADAVENRLHTLNPQNVNMCVWAFAILGMTPPPGAWRAMTTGMEEVIETLKPHEVMNAVWAMAAAHVTGEKLPLTPARKARIQVRGIRICLVQRQCGGAPLSPAWIAA